MKKMFLICVLFLSTPAFSQTEMLFATVNQDTVTILDSNAYRNCLMYNEWDIYVSGNQINLFERDTFTDCALCNCLFDFSVTFSNLTPGNYNASVFYFSMAPFCLQDTIFVGSVSFSISSKNHRDPIQIISEYTNPCHLPNGISEANSENFLEIFPNPATETITLTLPSLAGPAEVSVFDALGKEVIKLKVCKVESEVRVDVAKLPAGLYFVKANGYVGKFVKE